MGGKNHVRLINSVVKVLVDAMNKSKNTVLLPGATAALILDVFFITLNAYLRSVHGPYH